MRNFILLVSTTSILSCTSPQKELKAHTNKLHCHEAFLSIPELKQKNQALSSPIWATKSVVAYTYIGANYTAEILWDASIGVISTVFLCAPGLLVIASNGASYYGTSQAPIHCLPYFSEMHNAFRSPPLGKQAIKKTQKLRCPNLENLYNSIKEVAYCYDQRGEPEKAVQTLQALEKSKYFYSCLSLKKQKEIELKKQELTTQ